MQSFLLRRAIVAAAAALALANAAPAAAHCDGLDGPVVGAARRALDSGDINHALIWVREGDAAAIRESFREARAVRALGPQARDLADRHFFETLVRVHRAAEGAPYTGLAPAGRDLGAAIPAADKALATGAVGPVEDLVAEATREAVRHRFESAMAKRDFRTDDVAAGRAYVGAYVEYVHAVERIYEAAAKPGHEPGDHR